MTDISQTIAPKSDQLNSDDLIAGPLTIRITKISANPSSPEQPVSIYYEGDGGKPYKPCKSMRRVLVNTWGSDGSQFAGRSMTLYRDPAVKFGGLEVGGIRISHMSDITKPITIALTATRANRKPFTVHPLQKRGDDQHRHAQPTTLHMAARQDAGAAPASTTAPASALLRQYHERLSGEAFREDVEAAHAGFRQQMIEAGQATVNVARRILAIHTDRVEGRINADQAAADVASLLEAS